MGVLRVTADELASLSQSLRTGSDQVQAQLDAMRRQLEPVAAGWEGATTANFQRLWGEWQAGATQVLGALTGISTLLGEATGSLR